MARKIRRERSERERTSENKTKKAADVCHAIYEALSMLYYSAKKRQYKQYKKCAKFNKKTGFWKLKSIRKIKKSKLVRYK